jgi:WD40 repeat protein
MAVGSADASVSLWDIQDLICLRTFGELDWPVRTVSFSHDGSLLAMGSEDRVIDIVCCFKNLVGLSMTSAYHSSPSFLLTYHSSPSFFITLHSSPSFFHHIFSLNEHLISPVLIADSRSTRSSALRQQIQFRGIRRDCCWPTLATTWITTERMWDVCEYLVSAVNASFVKERRLVDVEVGPF